MLTMQHSDFCLSRPPLLWSCRLRFCFCFKILNFYHLLPVMLPDVSSGMKDLPQLWGLLPEGPRPPALLEDWPAHCPAQGHTSYQGQGQPAASACPGMRGGGKYNAPAPAPNSPTQDDTEDYSCVRSSLWTRRGPTGPTTSQLLPLPSPASFPSVPWGGSQERSLINVLVQYLTSQSQLPEDPAYDATPIKNF